MPTTNGFEESIADITMSPHLTHEGTEVWMEQLSSQLLAKGKHHSV